MIGEGEGTSYDAVSTAKQAYDTDFQLTTEGKTPYEREPLIRELGDELVKAATPFLIEKFKEGSVSFGDVIMAFHELTTTNYFPLVHGQTKEEDFKESFSPGATREVNVFFGTAFPPQWEDVTPLFNKFSEVGDSILRKEQSNPEESHINVIASWAYATMISIHPCIDGNGRSARATTNFVRQLLAPLSGVEAIPYNFPSSKEVMTKSFADIIFEAGLLPYSELPDGTKSSVALIAQIGMPKYFQETKKKISSSLDTIKGYNDISGNSSIVRLSRMMEEGTIPPKGSTKRLARIVAEEAVERNFG